MAPNLALHVAGAELKSAGLLMRDMMSSWKSRGQHGSALDRSTIPVQCAKLCEIKHNEYGLR